MDLFYTQEKAKEELEKLLINNNIVLLYGDSGSGKSALVQFILQEYHDSQVIITEYSNNSYRNSSLQSFKLALSRDNSKRTTAINDEILFNAVAKDMPIAQNTLTYFINRFKNKTQNKLEKEYFNVFNEDEKGIIIKLSQLSKQKALLLVFDNYHWANINDMNFINNLAEICINKQLFHNTIQIILIVTTNQNENPDFSYKSIINKIPNVNLDNIAVEEYDKILKIMHLKENITTKMTETIYSLTSGHLELTKKVVDYVNLQNNSIFNALNDIEEQALMMMTNIFDQMIDFSFRNKQDTIDILEIASVIGNMFNQYELEALTQSEFFLIEEHLSNAAGQHFIEKKEDQIQFIHPVIRELFYKKLSNKKHTYHKQYAEKLKILKPTEHLERAYHLEKCKDEKAALQETIIAYFFSILLQTHFPDSAYEKILEGSKKHKLKNYFTCMEKSIILYVSGQVDKSLEYLRQIDEIDVTNEIYGSLKKYLYAKNLLLYKFDTESFLQSAQLLECSKQCFYENAEFELYISTLMILLNIYAYKLCDIDAAQKIERQIIDLFHEKLEKCIDYKMEDYKYEYKRKSISLCTPEMACKRTNEVFKYFQNSENVMELYKSACDYSATCIFLGKYTDALVALEVCGQTVEAYNIIAFPEPFKPQSNYILASLYSNPERFWLQMDEAIAAYKQILTTNSYITKIIDVNLAGLYLLSGKLNEADNLLSQLTGDLVNYKSVFYYTFIYANLASLNILRCDYMQALVNINIAEKHLDEWGEGIRGFYKKQVATLKQIALNEEKLTPHQLFMRPQELEPRYLGATWSFVGRGVLFSELLFYTT